MMTTEIQEIRRRNLKAVIGRERGAIAEFSRLHNLDPSYISQILNKHRGMAEKSARNFEQRIGLPHLSLDEATFAANEDRGSYITDISLDARLEAIVRQMTDDEKERAIRMLEAGYGEKNEKK